MKKLVLFAFAALSLSLSSQAQAETPAPYVVMAPDGGALLRVMTQAATCPQATLDGRPVAMTERSAPRRFPARPSASGAAAAHPSDFPLRVCDAPVPRGVTSASVLGQSVPVVRDVVRRIVVVGDTGCRLKKADEAWQACSDPKAWPFAAVAKAAAKARPDLVLHVGDYHYRENACPEGTAGCAGSPWAYGWDAWEIDFFRPAAPLLAAAPWVMVRGNHEECQRAGQGWWLLLAPQAYTADCADPAQDDAGNHALPYAVELGDGARLIVADFSAIGEKSLKPAALQRYGADAAAMRALARAGQSNFLATHYPFGGVVQKKGELAVGSPAIGEAFGATFGHLPDLPDVTAMVSGHVHMLQFVALKNRPVQIVNGFSGTQEDAPKAPATLGDVPQGAVRAALDDVRSGFNLFGYGVLDRLPDGRWRYEAFDINGRRLLSRRFGAIRSGLR
jgi:hypothetical protein